MTYTEFFGNFPSFQSAGAQAFKPGLDRMLELDSLMGEPHRRYRTVHVAGTNGKGSVSNMIASALAATGLKVGLYTSPHILDLRERARVIDAGGVRIMPSDAADAFVDEWGAKVRELGMSFFEATTAMAFSWFADEKVDFAVIETGLGGRMDSTNIITPVLSVITNIGLDHCDILGTTLPEIAFEKAGIIKPGVPVVAGESSEETDPVFAHKAMGVLTFADRIAPAGWSDAEDILAQMDLQGSYQRRNLRTVLAALEELSVVVPGLLDGAGIAPAVRDAIIHTASRMDFHGRWERLRQDPEVICDIGHNAHGLRYNFSQLSSLAHGGRTLFIVYGSVADKDVDAVLRLMPPEAAHVIFTNADNHRALPAREAYIRYCRCCMEVGRTPSAGSVAESVKDAVDMALQLASGAARPLIYIGGSTYVVAEAVRCF